MRNKVATLFASVARALAQAYHSASVLNLNGRGVRISIDVTAVTSAPSVVPTVEVLDELSGAWSTVLTRAAIVAVGHTELVVYPGAIAVANKVTNEPIGKHFRLTMTHANTNSITYSASAVLIV
jgi:hypothetical protein